MKIVYLMRFWPVYGGGETVTRTLANEMNRRGHNVYVIYLWDRTNNTGVFVDPQIQEIKISGITKIGDGSLKYSEYGLLQKNLKKIFREIEPDIVIDQWLPTKQVSKALTGLRSKLIKCHHGSVKHNPVINSLKQKIFYSVFKKSGKWIRVYPEFKKDYVYSDVWVLLSEASKKEAEILIPWADEKRLMVITNPLPYNINSYEVQIKEKKKEIIYVGRIIKLKRLEYILRAWSLIENDVMGWKFRIVGDGDLLNHEKQIAEELELKNVIFEGFKDAKPFFRDAAILVMASAQEGFGMVLAEAQQYGCVPVVVDSFPTVHDIIEHGKNGILVRDGDVKEYARALSNLIHNEERRECIARTAMEDSKKFSVRIICDQWEALFETLEIRRGGEWPMKANYYLNMKKGWLKR